MIRHAYFVQPPRRSFNNGSGPAQPSGGRPARRRSYNLLFAALGQLSPLIAALISVAIAMLRYG